MGTERTLAVTLLGAVQALDLRGLDGVSAGNRTVYDAVRAIVPMTVEDRRQDFEIERVVEALRLDELGLGSCEEIDALT